MTLDMGQLSSISNDQYLNVVNIAKHEGGCLARFISLFFTLSTGLRKKICKREDPTFSSSLPQFPLKISLKLMRMDIEREAGDF